MTECQDQTVRRPTRREIAAAETRCEILRTARRLFAERGFAGTTIKRIAEEAGVAVQTVYSSVGAKSALVLALIDTIDEEAGVAELAADLFNQTKPAQVIAIDVRITRQLNERCGDLIWALRSAASSDPQAAAAVDVGMARHNEGALQTAGRLADMGALRAELTADQGAAVLAMMTSNESWQQLTQRAGWNYDEAESWLTASLIQLLLRRRR